MNADSRRDVCYAQFRDGQCLNPSTSLVTKSSCCCCTVSLGQPMGWGTPCQPCPLPDSEEFEQLCPFGSGKTHSGDGGSSIGTAFRVFPKMALKIWKRLTDGQN